MLKCYVTLYRTTFIYLVWHSLYREKNAEQFSCSTTHFISPLVLSMYPIRVFF